MQITMHTVASNISACIAIRKPLYSCFKEPCMHPARGSSIKILLQVTILTYVSWVITKLSILLKRFLGV